MAVKNAQTQELEENVVNEVEETTAMVEVVSKEEKKAKIKAGAKKVGKVLGIAFLGGLIGYGIGSSKAKKEDEYYDDSDICEAEVINADEE